MNSKEKVENLIKKQYKIVKEDPIPSLGISVGLKEDNYFKWLVYILPPDDSIYAGKNYILNIDFNENYPRSKPKVRFFTKIYHCNVSEEGQIKIPSLENWNENISMNQVLSDIFCLFYEQNTDNAFDKNMANEYKNNKDLFLQKIKHPELINVKTNLPK